MRKRAETTSVLDDQREWQFDISAYDRNPSLTLSERTMIEQVIQWWSMSNSQWDRKCIPALRRLLDPIDDVLDFIQVRKDYHRAAILRILIAEMHTRHNSYWAWNSTDWYQIIGTSEFYIRRYGYTGVRQKLIAFCYLIAGFFDLREYGPFFPRRLARLLFGEAIVERVEASVCEEVQRIGYAASRCKDRLPSAICQALIVNRSPRLEDLTPAVLEKVRDDCTAVTVKEDMVVLSLVLVHLGIFTQPLARRRASVKNSQELASGVPEEWERWIRRWRETSTLSPSTRKGNFYCLMKTGRWLAQAHPELAQPQAWTHESAIEYVAALCQEKVGERITRTYTVRQKLGENLKATSIAQSLSAMRRFFRDCQEWGWISICFDPWRVFRTPKTVRAKIGPEPRVIADDIWAKLLWAGINLTDEDLPRYPRHGKSVEGKLCYPLEMVRAVAVVWLFCGLRSNEIIRLRVGCIRWQHENKSSIETDSTPSQEAICWLDVPVNKTYCSFTKPVDRLVGEAIDLWEQVRPPQPKALDSKTGAMVNYLFSYRGFRIGNQYLNCTLIPMLCHKAGVPESDARGGITSHRARSTIATQLYNAREPMSLFDLQEWLGHTHLESTQH
ncbi:MAG: tyrosine-type recombinase/integrase, partial [Ktedonobacteraceae bacterium]|nr:tyrosine-type recombinase/integrase [Ktedonobacteraceae bacterium]